MTPENLLNRLTELKISYHLYWHEAVFSVADADKVDARIPGTHTRNLFLRDKKGTMFLVTLCADSRIDLKKLASLIGAAGRLSFASPERLLKYLGVTPGSVTPFSIVNDTDHQVTLILEKQMMETDLVNYHPLINTMTVGLIPAALLVFLKDCGCAPQILDLMAAAPDT